MPNSDDFDGSSGGGGVVDFGVTGRGTGVGGLVIRGGAGIFQAVPAHGTHRVS